MRQKIPAGYSIGITNHILILPEAVYQKKTERLTELKVDQLLDEGQSPVGGNRLLRAVSLAKPDFRD